MSHAIARRAGEHLRRYRRSHTGIDLVDYVVAATDAGVLRRLVTDKKHNRGLLEHLDHCYRQMPQAYEAMLRLFEREGEAADVRQPRPGRRLRLREHAAGRRPLGVRVITVPDDFSATERTVVHHRLAVLKEHLDYFSGSYGDPTGWMDFRKFLEEVDAAAQRSVSYTAPGG